MANTRSIRRAVRHIPVALAFVLAVSSPSAHATDLVANRSELIQSLLPAVVNIAVRKEVAPPTGSQQASASTGSSETKSYVGSGFVINPSGLIVTNYHVVEDAFDIAVTFSDGTILPATLLHASRLADLAVVQVKADHPLTPVQWGDSTKLNVGDQVFAIGNPLGLGVSVSAGIVSGLNRDVQDFPVQSLHPDGCGDQSRQLRRPVVRHEGARRWCRHGSGLAHRGLGRTGTCHPLRCRGVRGRTADAIRLGSSGLDRHQDPAGHAGDGACDGHAAAARFDRFLDHAWRTRAARRHWRSET